MQAWEWCGGLCSIREPQRCTAGWGQSGASEAICRTDNRQPSGFAGSCGATSRAVLHIFAHEQCIVFASAERTVCRYGTERIKKERSCIRGVLHKLRERASLAGGEGALIAASVPEGLPHAMLYCLSSVARCTKGLAQGPRLVFFNARGKNCMGRPGTGRGCLAQPQAKWLLPGARLMSQQMYLQALRLPLTCPSVCCAPLLLLALPPAFLHAALPLKSVLPALLLPPRCRTDPAPHIVCG